MNDCELWSTRCWANCAAGILLMLTVKPAAFAAVWICTASLLHVRLGRADGQGERHAVREARLREHRLGLSGVVG